MYYNFQGMFGEVKGKLITKEEELQVLAKALMEVDEFAYDTETNTLRVQYPGEMFLVGISISFGEENTYYIPTGHYFDDGQLDVDLVVRYLKPVFERTDVRIIGHNLKFDMHVLENVGIMIKTDDIHDTMVARWITDENKEKGLKGMTNQIYNVAQEKFDECLKTVTPEQKKEVGLKTSNKAPFYLVRLEVGAPYAMADAYWTWRHYCDWQNDEILIEEMEYIFREVQMPFLKTLYNMERRGVRIDDKKLKKMSKEAKKDLDNLIYEVVEMTGVKINPGSSQQLGELFFGYHKVNKAGEFVGNQEILDVGYDFPVKERTATGAPKTGAGVLKDLLKVEYKLPKKQEGQEVIRKILTYKKLKKLESSFMTGLIKLLYEDGRLHPNFNIVGTDSGRISASDPNLQQLPRPVDIPTEEEWLESEECKESGKSYTEKFGERAYWKKFEIRDVIIPDNPDTEQIVAFDKR